MICNSVPLLRSGFLIQWKKWSWNFGGLLPRETWLGDGRLRFWFKVRSLTGCMSLACLPYLSEPLCKAIVFYKCALRFFPILWVKDCVIKFAGRRWGITTSHKGSTYIETQATKGSQISIKLLGGQYMRNKFLDFNTVMKESNISSFILWKTSTRLLRQSGAFVVFQIMMCCWLMSALCPAVTPSIFGALIMLLVVINNQSLRNYSTLCFVIKSYKYVNRFINQLLGLKPWMEV